MSDNRESVIGMIRKLLSVTEQNGATENEAVAAALAAQRLIAKHDIEDWELAEKGEPIEGITAPKTREWQGQLALAIAENFRCRCYIEIYRKGGARRSSKNVVFYGYRQDAEAARLVYERLSEIGNRLGRRYATRRRQVLEIKGERNVCEGDIFNTWAAAFVRGVRDELEKQSQALMIICPPKVNEAFDEAMAGCKLRRERSRARFYGDRATMDAGRSTGRDSVRSGRMGEAKASGLITA